jgi:hypothetical protein
MPDDKIYVYGHSGDETPEIHVYQDKFNPTFEESFANINDEDTRLSSMCPYGVYTPWEWLPTHPQYKSHRR